jgi:hypothetical protein
MTDNFDAQENKSEAAVRKFMFPISAYANRIKLKAGPELPNSESAKIMFDILAKKKIFSRKADDAVLKALDAAADHRLAKWRFEQRQNAKKLETDRIDELISIFENLTVAISKLPPIAKSTLNARMADVTKEGIFDTEIFIELVNCVAACLSELSPKKNAGDALVALHPEGSPEQTWPIIMLWESIPPVTRTDVERNVERRLRRSGIALLRLIPDLLDKFRPTIRLGAPPSIHFAFARQIDRIWRELKLKSGHQYNGVHGHHQASPFIRFCNAALAAVGTEGAISDRQVSNLKLALYSRRRKIAHNGRSRWRGSKTGPSKVGPTSH